MRESAVSIWGWGYSMTLFGAICGLSFAVSAADSFSERERCLLDALAKAEGSTPVARLREQCLLQSQPSQMVEAVQPILRQDDESLIAQRVEDEHRTQDDPFVITPHKRNYVMFASYNASPNSRPYAVTDEDFSNTEIKFQLSFKVPVVDDLFGDNGDLYVAYTHLAFWQAYNQKFSSPFRETNYEPEVFLLFDNDWELFGWKNPKIRLGMVHQSNGRSEPLSRSWNRLFAQFIFEKDNLFLGVKPWYRIPEAEENDNNPDILDYMGYGELQGIYKNGEHSYSFMLRNNLNWDENRGAIQLDWIFPLHRRFHGYLQYFNGYGESMVDYNASSNRLSFGVALTDWL